MNIRHRFIACAIAGSLAFASAANATVIVWTLQDATFDDGGTASGSFEYNTVTGAYTDIDIVTTAGSVLNGSTYNAYSVNSVPRDYGFGSVVAGETADGDPILDINKTTDFTAVGTVSLGDPSGYVSAEGTIDGAYYIPARYLSGSAVGTAVPEPATWAMMLAGMGAVGFAMRRRATVRILHA